MPKVYIKFNAAIIAEAELTRDVVTFGRKEENDIRIDHPAVSGFHGKLVKEGDQYFVEDLDSTNGTFVNGVKIKRAKLQNKDNIRVAKHILEFIMDEPATSPPAGAPAKTAEGSPKASPPPSPLNLEAQREILRKTLGTPGVPPTPTPATLAPQESSQASVIIGVIKIISGAANNQTEIKLTDLVTYIGTSDQALIKIKGLLAPGLAAAISRRPEGYFLKAVKPGYPKVNGSSVHEQVFLENGSLIECGGTNMAFYMNPGKKKDQPPSNF